MALLTPTLFPGALFLRALCTQKNSSATNDEAIQYAIISTILGALNLTPAVFTTTINLSSYLPQDIQYWTNILNGLGYTTSYSSSTLTVSW